PLEEVTGRQLFDALYHGAGARDVVEGEILVEGGEVEVAGDFRMRQQDLHLRAEVDLASAPAEVERLDAHAVAGENQAASRLLPDGKAEHALELLEAVGIPFEKSPQQDFGIGRRSKLVAAAGEGLADFTVVVDFPVEDQDGASILARHGLFAVFEVDDAEAHSAERHGIRDVNAFLIGSAMAQRPGNPPNHCRVNTPRPMGIASYSAHR